MKSQLADFLSLLYPRTCFCCHDSLTSKEEFLCLSCELSLPIASARTNKTELIKKFTFVPKVSHAFALLDYRKEGISQKLVQAVKYQGRKSLGMWLGGLVGTALCKFEINNLDELIPIPIHRNRLRQRGYNQSEIIGQGVSESMNVPIATDYVKRKSHTVTQTKKSKIDRWESMKSVFEVVDANKIEGKRLLVLDDVITTGATMGLFCEELAKHNPESITVAAVAAGQ